MLGNGLQKQTGWIRKMLELSPKKPMPLLSSWCNQYIARLSLPAVLFNSKCDSQISKPVFLEPSGIPFILENIRLIFPCDSVGLLVNALHAFKYILVPVSITQDLIFKTKIYVSLSALLGWRAQLNQWGMNPNLWHHKFFMQPNSQKLKKTKILEKIYSKYHILSGGIY